jgi:hypothetical protein
MARATAATELVSRALLGGEDSLGEGAANDVLEEIAELQADVRGLGNHFAELRAQLNILGPATLATERIVAYWMSRDPANRELGTMPEMLEERLVLEMNQIGTANWKLLQEDRPEPPDLGAERSPAPRLRSTIERHLLYWESRARPPQKGQVQVSPHKARRIRSFAARNGCKPEVALEALLDLALSAAGEPGVPASQVEEVKAAIGDLWTILRGLRAQLKVLAHDCGQVGQVAAGLAPLLTLLCARDPGIRHPALQEQRLRIDPEELYARLSAYITTHAVSQWDGRLRSLLEGPPPEGPPVDKERRRPWARDHEKGGGGS